MSRCAAPPERSSAGQPSPAARPPLPVLAERLAAALPSFDALLAAETGRRVADPPAAVARAAARPGGAAAPGARRAAVLVLVGPGEDGGGDVVLTERAAGLRSHPGQVGFPGGGLEAADRSDPVVAALREAREEVGVAAADVVVLGAAASVLVPPRATWTTPVLAWSPSREPLRAVDPVEVARVLRVQLADLADPAARHTVRTRGGWTGPAFAVEDLVVWGFTGIVLASLLTAGGWEEPWDAGRVLDVPERFARSAPVAGLTGQRGAALAPTEEEA